MYLLEFLKEAARTTDAPAKRITVEHRLVCSGELYNARVQTGSGWRKSDATRVLARSPFELFVVSRPFDAYPQELCLRLMLDYATEQCMQENMSFRNIFLPDDEIVEDLCSLLSLLARRLIVPAALVREQYKEENPALGSFGTDFPQPLLSIHYTAWKQRPHMIITRGPDGQEIVSYHPPPLRVYPDILQDLLLRLPSLPESDRIIRAARLYREALEVIETRPDSAYQLLISVAETLSNTTPPAYEPTEQEMLENKRPLYEMALKFGLCADQARQLALEAGRGNPWTKRRFKAFLSKSVQPEELSVKDRVFHPLEALCPPPDKFSKALSNIYDLRSGNLHEGKPLPRSVRIGIGPMIAARDLPLNPLAPPEIPPVVWFERVVSLAVRRFILNYTSAPTSPFGDPALPSPETAAD